MDDIPMVPYWRYLLKVAILTVALAISVGALQGTTAQSPADRTPTEQRNLDRMLDYWQNVIRPLDADRIKDYVAPTFIEHEPASEGNLASLTSYIRSLHQRFPNGLPGSKPILSFVDGDTVILVVARRTVDNPSNPSKPNTQLGLEVFRVKDGKQIEHWGDLMRAATP